VRTVSMDIIFLDSSVLFGVIGVCYINGVMSYLFSISDNEKGGFVYVFTTRWEYYYNK
jgi:hypothetical protein